MFKYIKKYWYFALLAPIFMVGEVLCDLIQPQMLSKIIDEGVLGINTNGVGDINIVINTGILMIGTVLLGALSGLLCGVFANLCSQRFANDLRIDCFNKIMHLSFEQVDDFKTGTLITRITNDITQIQNLLGMLIRGFVRTLALFIGGIFCMIKLDITFGIILGISMPFIILFVYFFLKKAKPKYKELQEKLDNLNSIMQEDVSGARVIKVYVKENKEIKRFEKASKMLSKIHLFVLKLFSYMHPITNLILNFTIIAIIYVGNIRIETNSGITTGEIMAAITYTSIVLNAVLRMSHMFQFVSRAQVSKTRIDEILNSSPTIKDGNYTDNTKVTGKIELKNVSFAYPDSPKVNVLEDINLIINKGETIGILGSTGSGKTSLINLFPRFYDCTKGEVLIDDINVKDYKLDTLRNKISIALQKSELFSTTIFENITWGRDEATLEEVRNAAKVAQANDFIEEKEDGYFSVVAEKGMSLSGGQKQRINIARCILKNAEIIIFDDSTSALDLKTESLLYQELKKEYKETTKIIIAQRIASVKDADRIVVLDKGKIISTGTHDELLKTSKVYQEIYNSQLKGGVVND